MSGEAALSHDGDGGGDQRTNKDKSLLASQPSGGRQVDTLRPSHRAPQWIFVPRQSFQHPFPAYVSNCFAKLFTVHTPAAGGGRAGRWTHCGRRTGRQIVSFSTNRSASFLSRCFQPLSQSTHPQPSAGRQVDTLRASHRAPVVPKLLLALMRLVPLREGMRAFMHAGTVSQRSARQGQRRVSLSFAFKG